MKEKEIKMDADKGTNNENKISGKRSKRAIGSTLIGNIGEEIVAYELFLRDWMPTKNFLGGFDILATKQKEIRKIEVKTRTLERKPTEVSENLRRIFKISKNELEQSDFVICIIYPLPNWALIFKSKDIPRNKDGGGMVFAKFNGEGDKNFLEEQKYKNNLNNWDLLDKK